MVSEQEAIFRSKDMRFGVAPPAREFVDTFNQIAHDVGRLLEQLSQGRLLMLWTN